MHLHEVILYVSDMGLQASFYRDTLGLPVHFPLGKDDLSEEYWVVFDTGQCKLALHGGGEKQFGQDAPKVVFGVTDIEAARVALLEKGLDVAEIQSPAPGIQVANCIDPEGNRFSLESTNHAVDS